MSTPGYRCPNCGTPAPGNYCAQCGQSTHLHEDSFWGLLTHFVAHYFHYDSKFWTTLKTLLFRPGSLTIAYREKKRQRFIPPISLYIFISISFFLLISLHQHYTHSEAVDVHTRQTEVQEDKESAAEISATITDSNTFRDLLTKGIHKLQEESPEVFMERLMHSFPKMFFFMIPVLALLFKLRFYRRKDLLYAEHAVFALHYHSFVFIAALFVFLNPFEEIEIILNNIILSVCLVYFIIAIRKVYGISWFASTFTGIIFTLIYLILLLAVFIGVLILLLAF